jgi:hypothetical protein
MMMLQASREHYCVNKTVMKKANKDEECNNLIGDGGAGCANFKNTASKMYGQQTSLALQVEYTSSRSACIGAQQTCLNMMKSK